jgi:WD40 repeat protein
MRDAHFFLISASIYLFSSALSQCLEANTRQSLHGPSVILPLGHTARVQSLATSRDGHILASADAHTVILWDLREGYELRRFENSKNKISCLAISPDGRLTAVSNDDLRIVLLDSATGKIIHEFPSPEAGVNALSFSPDSRYLAAGLTPIVKHRSDSAPIGIVIFDCASGQALTHFSHTIDEVRSVQWIAQGQEIMAAYKTSVAIWNVSDGIIAKSFKCDDGPIALAACSEQYIALVSGEWTPTLNLLRMADGTRQASYRLSKSSVLSLGFSRDGRQLVATTDFPEGAIRVWDTATSQEIIQRTVAHLQGCPVALFSGPSDRLVFLRR